jgi:hypothetical protein
MAIACNCSCIAGIHAVHGDKKTRRDGRVLSVKKMMRDSYPARIGSIGRRAREVMPAARRALLKTITVAWIAFIEAWTLPAFGIQRNRLRRAIRRGKR